MKKRTQVRHQAHRTECFLRCQNNTPFFRFSLASLLDDQGSLRLPTTTTILKLPQLNEPTKYFAYADTLRFYNKHRTRRQTGKTRLTVTKG